MKFTSIDNNFTIFKENKCIVWGTGKTAMHCTKILKENNVNIIAYCDNNSSIWNQKFNETSILSPNDLEEYCKKESVALLIASVYFQEIAKQVAPFEIENIIFYSELLRFNQWKLKRLATTMLEPSLQSLYINHQVEKQIHDWYDRIFVNCFIETIWDNEDKSFFLVHAAPKTGNNIIFNSIRESMHITPLGFVHGFGLVEPSWIDYIKTKPLKIVTGLRDPIAQLLSLAYEMIDFYWDLPYFYDADAASKVMEDIIIPYALGKQPLDCYCTRLINRKKASPFVLNFFDEFKDNLNINVFDYSFDKEKGYSIIKKDNIELLIYQLEKIDNLEPVMQEFLNNKSFSFRYNNTNSAADKFYSSYYKDFISNYYIDKAIVDSIYGEPSMHHFYSESDINKMKNRWYKRIEA